MTNIASNIQRYRSELEGTSCSLIAISKTKPNELVNEAYETGQRDFGENKVQELATKFEALPKDIRWHMVGHLQRNKVKYIAPFVHLIHSVDSVRLLQAIQKEGSKIDRVIPVLLQMHIAEEEAKFGFDEQEIKELIQSDLVASLTHVEIKGLMGMGTNTKDESKISKEFRSLKALQGQLNQSGIVKLTELSMGMSGDYKIAVREGSTMIRIGTDIFGQRDYAAKVV